MTKESARDCFFLAFHDLCALRAHFVAAKATLKMGDSSSVARLLRGDPDDPTRPSWGGQFVRLWGHRTTVFEGWTNGEDSAEVFGITEFVVPCLRGGAITTGRK